MWRFVAVFRPRRASRSLARIERALGRLDPVTREVFLLHRLESLGYSEIAARLGISVAEVQACIVRAMLKLMGTVEGG